MKKIIAITLGIVTMIGFMLVSADKASARRPYWQRHPRHYRHHPKPRKHVRRRVNTKWEKCWDLNRDGWVSNSEATKMKNHPNKCPNN